MTGFEMLEWFLVILAADFTVVAIQHFYKQWKKKAASSVLCELCQKPRKVRLTKDGQVKACRTCRKLYHETLKENATAAVNS